MNFTSTNRKLILKLDLKSYESTVYVFEALHGPESQFHILELLRDLNFFSSQNHAEVYFQILKLARLKAVNTTLVPTWVISFKDPKVTSTMISKHSDASKLRNAPFFGWTMVSMISINPAKCYIFWGKSHIPKLPSHKSKKIVFFFAIRVMWW